MASDLRPRLRAMMNRGLFLPEARDLATQVLRDAERRAFARSRAGVCVSGCTAPVVTTDPEPLCGECREEMQK